MNHLRVVAVLVLAFVVGSCQTITEDMPPNSYGNLPSTASVPIVVIQLPLPAPASSLPTSPTQPPPTSGGGGTQPSAPTSAPQNQQPDNGCWRNNCNAVASVHAQVYYIQCNGEAQPNTKDATEGPSSCDIVLDATPKDAAGRATQSGLPDWNISGGRTVVNPGSFTPKVIGGGKGGEVTFSARVDGVTSNVYTFTFR
jgi:hypothetical protein